jgi:hypothetical protein
VEAVVRVERLTERESSFKEVERERESRPKESDERVGAGRRPG